MSQWSIDPKLSQRRLATLVRLLEAEATWIGKGKQCQSGELDANEMRQWARQCSNLLNAPATAPKAIEQMSDEELLS
jgi:hypothetical protein